MIVFIKCAVCCYTVAPRVNFSEEIIKYFELELELYEQNGLFLEAFFMPVAFLEYDYLSFPCYLDIVCNIPCISCCSVLFENNQICTVSQLYLQGTN